MSDHCPAVRLESSHIHEAVLRRRLATRAMMGDLLRSLPPPDVGMSEDEVFDVIQALASLINYGWGTAQSRLVVQRSELRSEGKPEAPG